MNLTNKQLQKLIKEELESVLAEQSLDEAPQANSQVSFVFQQLIKLLRKHRHAFDDADHMLTFLKALPNAQEIKGFRSLNFDAPEKPKSKGSVTVDDPTME